MATHASAEKASRQAQKRALRNLGIRSEYKTAIKKLRAAIPTAKGNKEALQTQVLPQLNHVQKLLMRAASKNIIHKNTAARKISRLSRAVTSASA